jgi:hypothetical protein
MQNTLFGVVGLTLGFITPTQLSHALYIQEIRRNVGRSNSRLGEICIELGYLTIEQVEFIIERSRVLRLSPYMKPQNAAGSPPEKQAMGENGEVKKPIDPGLAKPAGGDSGFNVEQHIQLLAAEERMEQDVDVTERFKQIKSRYETAIEQIKLMTETIQALREKELELAIRAETAEHELTELRQRARMIEANTAAGRNKGGLMRVFGK